MQKIGWLGGVMGIRVRKNLDSNTDSNQQFILLILA